MNFNNYREFLGGVLRNPKSFSTLFPTGTYLSEQLAKVSKIQEKKSVLELGSGSGAITTTLVENLSPNSIFCGLELDAPLVNVLRETFPKHRFEAGSATHISDIFTDQKFQLVIASLPWTLFSKEEKKKIISEVKNVLTPDGELIFFITKHVDHTASAKELKDLFKEDQFKIQPGPSVWLNLPPANIYKAKRGALND